MDDMEFARYSCDIRKVLKNMKNTDWIAQELLVDVIPDELIAEIFNE